MPRPAKKPARRAKGRPSPQADKALRAALKLLEQGKAGNALGYLKGLTQQAPRDPRPWEVLMAAHTSLGRHQDAADAGARAVDLSPDDPEVRVSYAKALQKVGEYDRALLEIERALYMRPDEPAFLHARFNIYNDTAQHAKAVETLDRLERVARDTGLERGAARNLALDRARMAPKHADARRAVEGLDPFALDPSEPNKFREVALHHLGRLYETLGDYDTAFDRYEACNLVDKPRWNPDVFSAYADKLIACWSRIDKVPPSTVADGSGLIFITGMMRSGTSLTEQMIAQLPGVTPGGEMNAINRAISGIEPEPHPMGQRPFPITLFSYTQKAINQMSRAAMAMYDEVAADGWVTDKQPHNLFAAPLIRRMFPGCKIINCRRDPLDTCLSNFVQTYSRPHPQTFDLYWLGRFYRDYERVSDAWSACETIDIHDLRYERLVDDPETETGRLCDYLGVAWTESMLAFHESDRTVRTASRDQVRRPLYTSSVKKHEHFTHRLGELYRGLGLEHPGGNHASADDDG